ncbi:MAG: hypothetical protein ACLQQ4_05395 [Bacteroidia bacterium]
MKTNDLTLLEFLKWQMAAVFGRIGKKKDTLILRLREMKIEEQRSQLGWLTAITCINKHLCYICYSLQTIKEVYGNY